MTLRMGDAIYPANLPPGLDAYAGYVDGRWPDYQAEIARFPNAHHLSIDATGTVDADCADVETGDLSSWAGYTVGYASASRIGNLIQVDGRPKKLWVAHGTNVPHICTSAACWPSSPVPWVADGTQWTNHGGVWDESLLDDNFFDYQQPTEAPDVLDANDQAWIEGRLNHYFTLVLFGDSEAAALGQAPQGHPANLYQMKQEVDAMKAELDALKTAGGTAPTYTGSITLTPG